MMSYTRRPGRPPGEWSDEEWRRRHLEKQEKRVLDEVISYLKKHKEKGLGVSLSEISRALHHRPDIIKRVVKKYNGTWMNGTLGGFEARSGYYVAWCPVGGDPILCLHRNEIAVIPVQQNQHEVICPTCGAKYLIKMVCECGHPLKKKTRTFIVINAEPYTWIVAEFSSAFCLLWKR